MKTECRPVVIGVGNEFRSDDALGLLVARELRRRVGDSIEVREMSGEGAELMEAWTPESCVWLIDAVRSGSPPGTVHRVDATEARVPAWFFSSHQFGVAQAVEMARTLGRLPRRLILYGIEAGEFREGIGLSDRVLHSVPELVAMIEQELAKGITA
jgi:hydrogenase maturation protease